MRAPDHRKLVTALHEANALAEKSFGEAYHGMILTGSRSLGYSTKASDVDYVLIATSQHKEISKLVDDTLVSHGFKPELLIPANPDLLLSSIKSEPKMTFAIQASSDVSAMGTLFGLSVGRRINPLRLKIVEEIRKRDDRNIFWEAVNNGFTKSILKPKELLGWGGVESKDRMDRFYDAIRNEQYKLPGLSYIHDRPRQAYSPGRYLNLPELEDTYKLLLRHTKQRKP